MVLAVWSFTTYTLIYDFICATKFFAENFHCSSDLRYEIDERNSGLQKALLEYTTAQYIYCHFCQYQTEGGLFFVGSFRYVNTANGKSSTY